MSLDYNLVRTRIDMNVLRANYRLLSRRGSSLLPVIKADAYGHGLGPVARMLEQEGACTLAVGTVGEALLLRKLPYQEVVVSLLGPLDIKEAGIVWDQDILPLIHREGQVRDLGQIGKGRGQALRVGLKFDTGMSRLGFHPDQAGRVFTLLSEYPWLHVDMVCSHLASADDPDSAQFVLEQGRRFLRVCQDLRSSGLTFRSCLANSAAILGYPSLHHELQRPGISLYGTNPFQGTSWEEKGAGLKPAMEVVTKVLSVHTVSTGESISYGRTFVADRDMNVAIVAAGYADNYSRTLSNSGWMLVRGQRARILGRVCMQMTAVDVSTIPGVMPGDDAYLLGGPGPERIAPDELAGWWKTITYEVFCLLGQNPREYVNQS